MQNSAKIVTWIIVAIVVLGGIYYWYTQKSPTPVDTSSQATQDSAQGASALPSGSDASDDSLAQDSASLDAQMQAFSSDTASIDSGINDKPVSQ